MSRSSPWWTRGPPPGGRRPRATSATTTQQRRPAVVARRCRLADAAQAGGCWPSVGAVGGVAAGAGGVSCGVGADAVVPAAPDVGAEAEPPAYPLGGGMTASRWPKSTRGASRCSPTASKYSARSTLNRPATTLLGHGLDLGVEVADGGVVVAAGRGDPVLGRGQLGLQCHEVLVGLEVGVGLHDGEEPAERLAEHVLALGLLGRRLARGHRGRARRDDVLEGAALVGGVTLDRLDEVADEVVPTRQLDVDLPPGLLHEVAQLDEPVVGDDGPADDEHQQDDDDDGDDHAVLPCSDQWSSPILGVAQASPRSPRPKT